MSYLALREEFDRILRIRYGGAKPGVLDALTSAVTSLVAQSVVDGQKFKYEEGRQAGYEEAKRDMLRVLARRGKSTTVITANGTVVSEAVKAEALAMAARAEMQGQNGRAFRVIALNEQDELFCPKSPDGCHTYPTRTETGRGLNPIIVFPGQCLHCGKAAP